MISSIRIQNFKSIHDLTIELGRINVIIGENGSGKSNILEAVAMGGAAITENKVSNKMLLLRGVRASVPIMMRSAFDSHEIEQPISITFKGKGESVLPIKLNCDNKPFSDWTKELSEEEEEVIKVLDDFINVIKGGKPKYKDFFEDKEIKRTIKAIKILSPDNEIEQKSFFLSYWQGVNHYFQEWLKSVNLSVVNNFYIYAPENHFLRQFEDNEGVLGIRGEGLFKLISVIAQESPEQLKIIKQHLAELLGWFEDFEIPENLFSTERRINIKDRYLNETLRSFDQRSANEGFLYLLFYFTLFVSGYTPKFFAIDNIDNALNPRLCSELVRVLSKLAKEHDKQALITTHNPSVLDGLDLEDDEQRLFVVSRNQEGHTQIRRVMPSKPIPGQPPVRLSEQFIRGYIGGLPKNF